MSLRLSPEASRRTQEAMRDVTRRAQEAEQAPDTDEAKRRLAAVWSAVHDAYSAIDKADRELRKAMIASIEGKAA